VLDPITRVGVLSGVKWVFATAQLNLNISRPSDMNVQPRFLNCPVKLRARTSDPFVFRQIMIEVEYRLLTRLPLANIMDLGANVGLASAYFLSRLPEARIFAVEADLDNFNACCTNLTPYRERARVFHGAAWCRRTTLTLNRKSCATDNTVTEIGSGESHEIAVEGWDIETLVGLSGFEQIDLLKIDIEGAEKYIFSERAGNWLPFVKNICIELHGDDRRQAFFSALADYDYEQSKSGELDMCLNLRHKYRSWPCDRRSQGFPRRRRFAGTIAEFGVSPRADITMSLESVISSTRIVGA
jgi:FkbM family methyltransferase